MNRASVGDQSTSGLVFLCGLSKPDGFTMRLKPQVHPLTWEVLTGVSNELRGGLMVTGLSPTVEARFKVDLRFAVTFGRQ